MKKNIINKIIALFVMCINAQLVFKPLYLLFQYTFTSIMFEFKIPDSVLIVNALLGIIGIFKSILLYKGKFRMIPFLIATFAIWLIVFVNYTDWIIF